MIKQSYMILFLLFLVACDRVDDSLNGRCVYAGKIYLSDTLSGIKDETETDSIVTITIAEDGKPYFLYEKKTVSKGNFIMDFLEHENTYKISATLKISGITYNGERTFKADNDKGRKYHLSLIEDTVKLTLYAGIDKRNQVIVVAKDKHNAPVPAATGALFSSSELFRTKNVLNANYSATGDVSGKIVFSNIKAGYYYMMVQKRLDTINGAPVLIGLDSFDVPESVIFKRPDIIIQ